MQAEQENVRARLTRLSVCSSLIIPIPLVQSWPLNVPTDTGSEAKDPVPLVPRNLGIVFDIQVCVMLMFKRRNMCTEKWL